jgi:glycosyltransferase involved in cell wall biosynthesis
VRIGIVVPTFPRSVTSSELWLAQGLGELGHDVVVITSGRKGARDRGWRAEAPPELDGGTRYRVREVATLPLSYAEASIPLRPSDIFSERPDVWLLQEDYPPFSLIVARHAHRHKVPFFVTCERYNEIGPHLFTAAIRTLNRSILPRIWRKSAALTFHSRASMQYLAGLGAPPDRLHYIPASTSGRFFTPGPEAGLPVVDALWPADRSRVRLLTVARLHTGKGLDTLAQAMTLVRRKEPGIAAVIVHGRSSAGSPVRATLEESVRSGTLSLAPAPVTFAELPALYRSADIYVQPSRTEPFGMATLEAMACGIPVVASNTGGLADLVEDGTNGYLVPPGDPKALASALLRLTGAPDLRARMGRASRERAASLFEMQPVARSYDELLHRVRA